MTDTENNGRPEAEQADLPMETPAAQNGSAPAEEGAQTFTAQTLDDLPPEARPLVERRLKEMQGDYTKKTQASAEERDFAALGRLVAKNPQLAAVLQGQNQSSAQPQQNHVGAEEEEAIQALEPKAVQGVQALFRKLVREELAPAYEPVIQTVRRIDQERVLDKWERVVKDIPEADDYKAEIIGFLQENPSITDLKKGVWAAVGEKILERRTAATRRQDTAQKQQAQLSRPGVPANQTKPTEAKHSRLADALATVLAKRGTRQ